MNDTLQFFLQVLNDSIHGRCTKKEMWGGLKVELLGEYMNKTGVGSLVYQNLENAAEGETQRELQKLAEAWKKYVTGTVFRQMQMNHACKILLRTARERGLTLICFKGAILADLYPQYNLRQSADSDIYVYPKEKEQAIALLEELGYQYCEEGSNEQVPVYFHPQKGHKIELHYCLWEDYEGKNMKILESFDLTGREKLISLNVCNGMEVYSMSHTDHLIFQIFHIVKHFMVEGIGLRYVTDITLFVERYFDEIDWTDFWKKMKKIKYDTFVETLFSMGICYFELREDCLKGRKKKTEEEIENVLLDLVICGEIKGHKEAGWQILGIMTPYLEGEQKVCENRLCQRLRVMFPGVSALPEEYGYAKRCHLLLPVAWFHKGMNFLKKRRNAKDDWYSASEKIEIVEHRLELMKQQNLVEKDNEEEDK